MLSRCALIAAVLLATGCGAPRAAAPRATPTAVQVRAPSCAEMQRRIVAHIKRYHPHEKITGLRSSCAQLHVQR